MKKAFFPFLLLTLLLFNSPVWAICCPMGGMGMGPGMMGHGMMSGMGMGPGMMGQGMGMGTGPGIMGGMMGGMMDRMGRGMQACMLQECWHDGGGIMPAMIVHTAFREISGYQVNAANIGLSEDQLQRLGDLKENLTASVIRTHADLQIGAIELRRTMSRDVPDVASVEKMLDNQTQMWSKLQKTAVRAVAEARNVLTEQQRQQAKKIAAAGQMMRMPMEQQSPESLPPRHEQHHGDGM